MGAAKRRGNYEVRKAQGEIRKEAERIESERLAKIEEEERLKRIEELNLRRAEQQRLAAEERAKPRERVSLRHARTMAMMAMGMGVGHIRNS